MSVDELIKTLLGEFQQIVKTETVVGEPVIVGEVTIIPVSKVSFGFGAGGSGGKGEKSGGGSGTGGGATLEPLAFLVVKDGKVQLLPLKEKEGTFEKLLELAPDLYSKVREFRARREKKKGEGEKEGEAKGQD
jgi:sporulation protein YtfJ